MTDAQQYGVHYPALETVRQALQQGRAKLTDTVESTQDGCTAAARAYPGWATSAALLNVHAAQAANLRTHASDIGHCADRLQISADNYRTADQAVQDSIVGIHIPGGA